jgi:uncharacterized protein (TIGR00730 family)
MKTESSNGSRKICVYCASSQQADPIHADTARRLGELLAGRGDSVVYGGGAMGSMRALADGALDAGGRVIGVIPHFMQELEWSHPGITELIVTQDMHDRKRRMMEMADAVVALPGGSGTFEELLEAITWKRLGLFIRPIVVVSTGGYFDPLIRQLETAIEGRFMDERHRNMWTVVASADNVPAAIDDSPDWSSSARNFAVRR